MKHNTKRDNTKLYIAGGIGITLILSGGLVSVIGGALVSAVPAGISGALAGVGGLVSPMGSLLIGTALWKYKSQDSEGDEVSKMEQGLLQDLNEKEKILEKKEEFLRKAEESIGEREKNLGVQYEIIKLNLILMELSRKDIMSDVERRIMQESKQARSDLQKCVESGNFDKFPSLPSLLSASPLSLSPVSSPSSPLSSPLSFPSSPMVVQEFNPQNYIKLRKQELSTTTLGEGVIERKSRDPNPNEISQFKFQDMNQKLQYRVTAV